MNKSIENICAFSASVLFKFEYQITLAQIKKYDIYFCITFRAALIDNSFLQVENLREWEGRTYKL